jgi:hypothetical protein
MYVSASHSHPASLYPSSSTNTTKFNVRLLLTFDKAKGRRRKATLVLVPNGHFDPRPTILPQRPQIPNPNPKRTLLKSAPRIEAPCFTLYGKGFEGAAGERCFVYC